MRRCTWLFSISFLLLSFSSLSFAAIVVSPEGTKKQAASKTNGAGPSAGPSTKLPEEEIVPFDQNTGQAPPLPTPKPNPYTKPTKKEDTTSNLTNLEGLEKPSLVTQGAALALMSLLPFLIMMLSSFVKIVVVLSLLRSALGVQQAPPNQVINGVALLLSIYVMFPTGVKMYDVATTAMASRPMPKEILSGESAAYIIEIASVTR